MPARLDLRNVAIVAHVDHGKTTLVDAMLWQSGVFRENQDVADRVMDSTDLEREKGITILAKNTAVNFGGVKLNIVDTPGHADFGGEVERALAMVDGVLLLVDAAEGPQPQTRFVLRKTLEARLPVILVINKVDRPDARVATVVDEVYELFLDLDAEARPDRVPHRLRQRPGRLGVARRRRGGRRRSSRCSGCWWSASRPRPTRTGIRSRPWSPTSTARPTSAGWRCAGSARGRSPGASRWPGAGPTGTIERVKVTDLFITEALSRVPAESAGPGEIIAVAGLDEVTIGETLADAADPRPLPVLRIDEPSLSMTIGVNTSPLAGQGGGTKLTARLVKSRLDTELVGNVSLRVFPTARPDTWEVQGRGELQLAVLVETMRREGFELTVGKPQVVTREIDGKLCEPVERMTVFVPEEHLGAVQKLLAARKGRVEQLVNHGHGWVRIEYLVPARGLIGFRTEFMTETRGTGILHHVFESYEPWFGEIRTRNNGSMVADRRGQSTTYALLNLSERGEMLVGPGADVYEGMIVGENSRGEDMDVNVAKEKKLTNMRSSTAEELVRLPPPRNLSLEQALEFISDDEASR